MFSGDSQIYKDEITQLWVNALKIGGYNIKAVVDEQIMMFENLEVSLVENALKIYKN